MINSSCNHLLFLSNSSLDLEIRHRTNKRIVLVPLELLLHPHFLPTPLPLLLLLPSTPLTILTLLLWAPFLTSPPLLAPAAIKKYIIILLLSSSVNNF